MCGKTFSCGAFVGIVTLVLTVMIPWAAWGAPGPQALRVEKAPAIAGCPVMSDSELNAICGRYNGYFFGLDINVNLCKGAVPVTLTPDSVHNTPGTTFDPAKGLNFNDGNVAYQSGFSKTNVYQTVQVNGTGIPVTGLVNLNITVPQSLQTIGRPSGLSIPGHVGPWN
jgi:hypothetical protein